MFPHVALVIGTRPELIKLAPVAQALSERRARVSLVITGQHPGLDLPGAGLQLPPLPLRAPVHGFKPLDAVDAISAAARNLLARLRPDWVVVQGDTSSALGGARAASALGLPLAHVEAGLRSGDAAMPWPEEPFRTEIDGSSDLLFAPTPGARDNLLREGVAGRILVTGNTGIDALRAAMLRVPMRPARDGLPLLMLTAHRRENVDRLDQIADGIHRAASSANFRLVVLTHLRPEAAARAHRAFSDLPRTRLLPPQTADRTLRWMLRSTVILSDSGGISEEAPTLGCPLLILRERTERPEAVAAGSAVLVGSDPARIRDALLDLLHDRAHHAARAQPRPVFGDGHAAGRIADALIATLGAARAPVQLDAPFRAA